MGYISEKKKYKDLDTDIKILQKSYVKKAKEVAEAISDGAAPGDYREDIATIREDAINDKINLKGDMIINVFLELEEEKKKKKKQFSEIRNTKGKPSQFRLEDIEIMKKLKVEGKTNVELAKLYNISVPMVSRLINGKIKNLRISNKPTNNGGFKKNWNKKMEEKNEKINIR